MFDRLKTHLRELKQVLSTMTFKEKVEHIFTYYSLYMFIACVLVLCTYLFINALISYNEPSILNGTLLGVSAKTEGMDAIHAYVTEDGQLEGKAFLDECIFLDSATIAQGNIGEKTAEYLMARTVARHLDYMIMDERVFNILSVNYLIDLREVLPQEVLDRWPLVYKEDPELGEMIPVGIVITDTEFAQKYLRGIGELYYTGTSGILNTYKFIELADFLLK